MHSFLSDLCGSVECIYFDIRPCFSVYLWVIHFYCRVVSHCVYIPQFISHVLTGIWIVSKFLYSSGLLNISDRNIHIRACILAFFTLMWIPRVEDCVIYRCLCKFLRNSQLFSKGYIILCTPPRGGVSEVQLLHLLALDTVNFFTFELFQ